MAVTDWFQLNTAFCTNNKIVCILLLKNQKTCFLLSGFVICHVPKCELFRSQSGSTALMYASFNNHAACVRTLLEHGADLTALNEDRMTAFDLAVGQDNKSGTLWCLHDRTWERDVAPW